MDRLLQDVQYIKGVGPRRHQLLQKMDIHTVLDLLWYVPRAYFNRSKVEPIAVLREGVVASVRGRVTAKKNTRTRRGFSILKAMIADDSGIIAAVWFNQPYLAKQLDVGQEIFLSGRVKNSLGSNELHVNEFEMIDREDTDLQVAPIYSLTDGLTQKVMRQIIGNTLNDYLPYYPDILDQECRNRYGLCDIKFAFHNIHFPSSGDAYLQSRRRLAFEELFLFKLRMKSERACLETIRRSHTRPAASDLVERITDALPFVLTAEQSKVVAEIITDMKAPAAMNRLLQGDVGSGKTVVAALAMAYAIDSGYQAAIMVPTEVLAEQHYASLSKIFSPTSISIARLTGGTPAGERRLLLEAVAAGEIDILVGTHALIQDQVNFHNLGLAVIDEQHRFGVRQREQLHRKGSVPDVLVMTATPIPRTLALALYGDLNVSVIHELPPGRKAIKTAYVPSSSRYQVYGFTGREIAKGAQAYVVCPLVEESENQDLQAAVTLYEELKSRVYPQLKIGLLHGRMKASEKDNVMRQFKTGQIDILVATTVVEVGVDISNATIIIIEHAERFGLSQLHQLRGRVGRGQNQSFCFLIGEPKTEEAVLRLEAMTKTTNGFELANQDLLIRGPGDFWGVKQHGLDELKVANLLKDQKILAWASEAANTYDPSNLKSHINLYINNKFKSSSGTPQN